MKYIKYFEHTKNKYKNGDYIIFDKVIEDVHPYKNYGIIKSRNIGRRDFVEIYMYDVNYIDDTTFELKNIEMFYIGQDEIVGLMTEKQIEDFKITIIANKFNI